MQPVHLPPAAGVHRHGPGVDVPPLRQRGLRQGVHRQANQPVQVLRLRVVRQRGLGAGRHPGDARFPDRHEAAESAAEALEGRLQAVLTIWGNCGEAGIQRRSGNRDKHSYNKRGGAGVASTFVVVLFVTLVLLEHVKCNCFTISLVYVGQHTKTHTGKKTK